jgi:release factor glutamine methyltransferase
MKSSLLSDVTTQLTPISDTPGLDASVLIAHVINQPRTWVMAHPELGLTAEQQKELDDSLARLERGESFPYVLGHWEFFGLDLEVTPDVLIPRPETELLVEKAIVWLQKSPVRRAIADVGTGSGAIAVSIAVNVPGTRVLAADISYKALEVARKNAIKFDVINRIDFVQCDLLPSHIESLPTELHFDLICANLPYIPTKTLHNLPIFGREPTLALDGGMDGLDPIRRLLNIALEWLAPNGMILLEIESSQGIQALNLARVIFSEARVRLHQDLARQDRLLEIKI